MVIKVRFGSYGTKPQDAGVVEINMPDDTLFYVCDEHYIGKGLHIGAKHYIAITKAPDEELEYLMEIGDVDVIMEHDASVFRMNGYALISLTDCIIDGLVNFLTESEFNDLIRQENLYYVHLSQNYNIIKVIRINSIIGTEDVQCSVVRNRDDFDVGQVDEIQSMQMFSLDYIIDPYKRLARRIDTEYGKKLFSDMCSQIMHKIDNTIKVEENYDLDWLNKRFRDIYPSLSDTNKTWHERIESYMNEPHDENLIKEYESILSFKKELPKRQ